MGAGAIKRRANGVPRNEFNMLRAMEPTFVKFTDTMNGCGTKASCGYRAKSQIQWLPDV